MCFFKLFLFFCSAQSHLLYALSLILYGTIHSSLLMDIGSSRAIVGGSALIILQKGPVLACYTTVYVYKGGKAQRITLFL